MTVNTPHHHTNSESMISQLLLTRFWPNFKDRFLGLSWTDSNSQGDIFPGNSCQGDICPYQEYIRCYWPYFDQTLKVGSWDHLEQIPTVTETFIQATFVLAAFVHIRNISSVTRQILTKFQKLVPGTIVNRCQLSRWHLSRQHLSWQHLSISRISQLLLTRFWQTFFGPKINSN